MTRPERALLHPLWLASLLLLIANDHIFKGSGLLHAVITGKLSDVVGLIVAPVLLAALLRVSSRRALVACHVATGAVFAAIQFAPGAAFVELILPWTITPDLTDLLTLPALMISWHVLVPTMTRPLHLAARLRRNAQLAVGTIGLLACFGTSSLPPKPVVAPQATQVVAASEALSLDLSALTGNTWHAAADDSDWYASYTFEADGRYTTSGYPAYTESGTAELVEVDGQRMRLRLSDRIYDGTADETIEIWLTVADDGASFEIDGDRYDKHERLITVAAD